MKTLLTANLSTKTVTSGGSAWDPPSYLFGETITIALRFAQDVDGQTVEPALNIQAIRAAIGLVDARPESGQFALQIGNGPQTAMNTTALIPHDASPTAFAAAINALEGVVSAYGPAQVTKSDGSWIIIFGDGSDEAPCRISDNSLWPVSAGQCNATLVDGVWRHELRLLQAPVAFTDTAEAILPDPPTITALQTGGSDGGFYWNEVQALYVPPDFRATYILRQGLFLRTSELNVNDTAETIQSALEEAFGTGNIKVSNTRPYTANIEFVGKLKGTPQVVLTVQAMNPPPGDLTFSLALDRDELAASLRRVPSVTLPLEVRLWVKNQDDIVTSHVAFHQEITILRPVVWPELALTPGIDWLRPPSPKTYIPFNRESIITGQQFYTEAVGDAEHTAFVLDHGLNTDYVRVWVRENTTPGAQLIEGTDYVVFIENADSVTITALGDAPAATAWLVTIISAQTVAAFAAGLEIEIGQVSGLQALLDELTARVENLESLLPSGSLTREDSAGAAVEIEIPDRAILFPDGRLPEGFDPSKPETLGRAPGLLPAIHDATVTTQSTVTLPEADDQPGQVFQNTTGHPLDVPGGLGQRGRTVPNGGFFGSDGRLLYRLARVGSTNSYFPTDFELELIPPIHLSSSMWGNGDSINLEFDLSYQLLRANTNAQYLLVIEAGTISSATSPAPVSTNLAMLDWSTVLLSHQLILTDLRQTRHFGAAIRRSAAGNITAEQLIQNQWSAALSTPSSATVVLRVRLVQFDTEDSAPGAVGFISAAISSASCTLS